MMIPGLLVVSSVILYPLLSVFFTSFFKWQGLGFQMKFIGFDNYIKIFTYSRFAQAFKNNLIWLAMYLVIPVLLGFLLALLLNTNVKGQNVFKSIFYIPGVISFAVIGVIWSIILENQHGMINTF